MKEYQFFLSIFPEYEKGKYIKYADELKYLYSVYQKYQTYGFTQDDILKEPEFYQLKTILLLNELNFNHNFIIQNVNQKTIDFLNQLYDYFPDYFKNIQDDNIYRFRHNLIHKLPSFSDENLKTITKTKTSILWDSDFGGFFFKFFIFNFIIGLFVKVSVIPALIISIISAFVFSFIASFQGLKRISYTYQVHQKLKKSFPNNFIDKIQHYQSIPINIIPHNNDSGYNSETKVLYGKINNLIHSSPNMKWEYFDVYEKKDISKAFESMKSIIRHQIQI